MRTVKTRLVTSVVFCAAVGALAMTGLSSAGAAAALDDGVTAKSIDIGYIFSKTGVAGSTFLNADKGCQARIDRQNANGRRERPQDQRGDGRRPVGRGEQDRRAGPRAEQARVHGREQLLVRVPHATSSCSTPGVPMVGGGFDGTYYGEPGNENIISASGNVVARQRRHLRQPAEAHEEDGRQEGRRAGLRHLGVVDRRGGEPPEVRRSRGRPRRPSTPTPRSTSAAPTSARRCSASRTPAPTPSTCRSSPAPTSRSCRASPRTA